jgi:tRNA (guanine10-N2)-dimethyltransferase
MKYFFELSKEHSLLPQAEIEGLLHAYHIGFTSLVATDNVFLIETYASDDDIQNLAKRLSYTYHVDRFLFSSPPDLSIIKKQAEQNPIQKDGSLAIRCKNRSSVHESKRIVEALADPYTAHRKVKLTKPDIEIRALITDKMIYVGEKLYEIKTTTFEQRRVQFRPFFSPVSMHPKLARALVNISAIKPGEYLLDPCCGTGGVLLEAGLMGIHPIGCDIEEKMIEGCKQTLSHYNIPYDTLYCTDIGDISSLVPQVDAVVTDFPYGKATTTKGEPLEKLYRRAFQSISQVLKKGKRAVIGMPGKKNVALGKSWFTLLEVHAIRVHKSLTRYFAVYQNE